MLRLLAEYFAPASVAEMADFAATLAQRLADLVKARKLAPGSKLWMYAVDNLLVKAVDGHTQVHDEVLRLLLAASLPVDGGTLLAPREAAAYLKLTLEHSKRSRKRWARLRLLHIVLSGAAWSGGGGARAVDSRPFRQNVNDGARVLHPGVWMRACRDLRQLCFDRGAGPGPA